MVPTRPLGAQGRELAPEPIVNNEAHNEVHNEIISLSSLLVDN